MLGHRTAKEAKSPYYTDEQDETSRWLHHGWEHLKGSGKQLFTQIVKPTLNMDHKCYKRSCTCFMGTAATDEYCIKDGHEACGM